MAQRVRKRKSREVDAQAENITRPRQRVHETMTERAYRLLKENIIHLRLLPGSSLSEAAICKQLDLGRTPVNYALHRLHRDGLVKISPRSGICVSDLSKSDLMIGLAVRRIILPAVAAAAAIRPLDQATIEYLETLLPNLDETADFDLVVDTYRQFYTCVAEAGCNFALVQILEGLCDRVIRYWVLARLKGCNIHFLKEDLSTLVACFRRQDGVEAARIVRERIDKFEADVLRTCGPSLAP